MLHRESHNDIGNEIAKNTTIRLFADDALCYCKIKSHGGYVKLQDDLNQLMDWGNMAHGV